MDNESLKKLYLASKTKSICLFLYIPICIISIIFLLIGMYSPTTIPFLNIFKTIFLIFFFLYIPFGYIISKIMERYILVHAPTYMDYFAFNLLMSGLSEEAKEVIERQNRIKNVEGDMYVNVNYNPFEYCQCRDYHNDTLNKFSNAIYAQNVSPYIKHYSYEIFNIFIHMLNYDEQLIKSWIKSKVNQVGKKQYLYLMDLKYHTKDQYIKDKIDSGLLLIDNQSLKKSFEILENAIDNVISE